MVKLVQVGVATGLWVMMIRMVVRYLEDEVRVKFV